MPWFGATKRTPSGIPSGRIYTYASMNRKMQTVSSVRHVWGSFKFSHNGTLSRKQCIAFVNAWGILCARERCLKLRYRGMRRITYSPTSREIEALLDHLDQLRATCTPLLQRPAQKANFLSYRTGSHILLSPCATSNPPSHTSTLQVSCRTPLEFGSSGQR